MTLIVTDAAGQSRRHVEWGLEGPLTYNAATSLLVDSDDMVTSGFAGAQSSATAGAYDPNASGNTSIFCTLYLGQLVAVCGTGDLSHVGSFRVKARVYTNTGTQVRLSYKVGDGPLTSNPWATNTYEAQWVELDLGTITIPPVLAGTQRWTGRIDVNPVLFAGGIQVDYLVLIPVVEGYGKARASYSYSPGVLVALDQFTGTTAAAALNTRVAPLGGTWATSGDATDLVFDDNFLSGDGIESIKRSTSSAETNGRTAILGSTTYADVQIETSVINFAQDAESTLIARYVDSSNYARLRVPVTAGTGGGTETAYVETVVAGAVTVVAAMPWTRSAIPYRLRLIAYASGRVIGTIYALNGATALTIDTSSSILATGGTLASGKVGFRDRATGTNTAQRNYDDFAIATPAAEPIAINSGRTMQIRYDDVIRQDTTGTYAGRPPSYNGSRFLVPVGTSRVLVKARRNDVETNIDDQVTDAVQIQITFTPRGLAVPR